MQALKAIQDENSTFIHQYRYYPADRDASVISADLKFTQNELGKLDDRVDGQLSELQATTIHEVYNQCLKEAPKFIDTDRISNNMNLPCEESQIVADDNLNIQESCTKSQTIRELNEALAEENERLRDHMESMIVLVQQFE